MPAQADHDAFVAPFQSAIPFQIRFASETAEGRRPVPSFFPRRGRSKPRRHTSSHQTQAIYVPDGAHGGGTFASRSATASAPSTIAPTSRATPGQAQRWKNQPPVEPITLEPT